MLRPFGNAVVPDKAEFIGRLILDHRNAKPLRYTAADGFAGIIGRDLARDAVANGTAGVERCLLDEHAYAKEDERD